MAKTRMKTTPTRMQKDALIASAATSVTIKPTTITTTCHNAVPLDEVKKRLRQATVLSEPIQSCSSTIIVTAPKRTNSISSVASSISQTSDAHSDTESPPPQAVLSGTSATTTKSTKPLISTNTSSQAPRTLNNLLCKPTNALSALRNRKVFMITEKSNESGGTESSTSAAGSAAPGQKRKMYLVMEENNSAEDEAVAEDGIAAIDGNKKYLKRENGLIVGASSSKKLTLFTNKIDSGALTEKFEKILPEILNCIQSKEANVGTVLANVPATTSKLTTTATPTPTPIPAPTPITMMSTKLLNGHVNFNIVKSEPLKAQQQQQHEQFNKKTTEETTERLPITLPPKKNRTKINTTNINNTLHNSSNNNIITFEHFNGNTNNNLVNNNNNNYDSNHKIGAPCQIKQISAATPVIVSSVTGAAARSHNNHSSYTSPNETKRFPSLNNGSNNSNNTNIKYATNGKSQAVTSMAQVEVVPRNINLSADFHFLMEMLPKLESIPEPHKTNVKNCIEKVITQNANIFVKK